MSTNKQKAAFFKEKLLQNEILVKSGYTLAAEAWKLFGTELHGPNEDPYYQMNLSNQSNRELSMSVHFNGKIFIYCSLKNTVEEDLFGLTDWMMYHPELRDQKQVFYFDNYPEGFEVAVRIFFENLNRLFEYPDLKLMLEGKDWKEIHFDWGDLK
ncbi:MAG: hypothetical protein ACO1N0_03190 [Fluviicola sp.]